MDRPLASAVEVVIARPHVSFAIHGTEGRSGGSVPIRGRFSIENMIGSKSWRKAIHRAMLSGSVASLASTLVLCACGKKELDSYATPLNGPSQWILGKQAPYGDGLKLPHTVIGYAIHHAMSVCWAVLFERWQNHQSMARTNDALLSAIATSALACFVDYQLTPDRLTPGFEKRLSRKSLFIVYAAFAVGLAIGSNLNAHD